MLFFTVLQWIKRLFSGLSLHRVLYMAVGAFKTRAFPATDQRYRYAVLIAARNEEAVIGNLLASIRRQDYDGEVTVFTVADNCTDRTADLARAGGAICYERFDPSRRTKGYALRFLVECIRRDYGIRRFDGYFIFDADNLLRPDYISRMNEAFAAGEKIITSYRNTKNFADNWISASYALHWLRTVRFEHRARSVFGLATRIQGTGFLFAGEIIEEGWKYTSFTEDRAFSADAVLSGYRISYNHAAEFFDEQPTDIKTAFRQRIRWSKGHLQAALESGGSLFCSIFKPPFGKHNFICFDMLSVVVPHFLAVFPAGLLLTAGQLFTARSLEAAIAPAWGACCWALGEIITAAYLFMAERRRVPAMKWYQKLWFCLTFPFFDVIGRISLIIALFLKVEWKPIPHKASLKIEDIK